MKIAIDCFNFVGMDGGSGGAGAYILSLMQHIPAHADMTIVCSAGNRDIFNELIEQHPGVDAVVAPEFHAVPHVVAGQADLLYAPFTEIYRDIPEDAPPVVTAIHDLQHRKLPGFFPLEERRHRDAMFLDAATRAGGIVTFSEIEKNNILEAYAPSAPIGVVPHAPFMIDDVEARYGAALQNARPPSERLGRYLFYPAVDWPHKNHMRLLQAFEMLVAVHGMKDLKLVLSGASCVEPRTQHYKEFLSSSPMAERIVHLGFLSSRQLYQHMKHAAAVVFPSLYEGFGIPVLEAMKLGTQVFASDLPVFREWFDGRYIPLSEPLNAGVMARELAEGLQGRQKGAGVVPLADRFNAQSMTRDTLKFFEQVVRSRRTPVRAERRMTPLASRPASRVVTLLDLSQASSAEIERYAGLIEQRARAAAGFRHRFAMLLPAKQAFASRGGLIDAVYAPAVADARRLALAISDYAALLADAECIHVLPEQDAARRLAEPRFFDDVAALASSLENEDDVVLPDETAEQDLADLVGRLMQDSTQSTRSAGIEFVSAPARVARAIASPFSSLFLAEASFRRAARVAKPKFAFVEPQLRGHVGHFFSVVSSICGCAQELDFEPIVGAHMDYQPAAGLRFPVDSGFSSYASPEGDAASASIFARELERFIERNNIGAGDYVYLHMPSPYLILGALEYVNRASEPRLPVFLIRVCSTDESFQWFGLKMSRIFEAAAELGARRNNFRVFVESKPLQTYFEKRTGISFPVLFNPITPEMQIVRPARTARRSDLKRVVFGYFGEAREEKGFLLLPAIIENVIAELGPKAVQFLVQVSANQNNRTPALQTAVAQVRKIAEKYRDAGTIRILESVPDMYRYYEAIGSCHGLILPYDPKPYAIRGSGVALEALALGTVAIVSAGSDMATTFAGGGCIVSESYTAAGMAKACVAFVRDAKRHLDAAWARMDDRAMFRNEKEFMQALVTPVAERAARKPVCVWIGNDVLGQGCSSVYASQREFLRQAGYEIYNVFVPWPEEHPHSDVALEKYLSTTALGWREDGYDFGCYSWTLNQTESPERTRVLDALRRGADTRLLHRLNQFNTLPQSLLSFLRNRKVDRIVLNYVHLDPVRRMIDAEAPYVLETHDIQAEQHAIRNSRPLNLEEVDWELDRVVQADHVVAISAHEADRFTEFDTSAKVSWLLPPPREPARRSAVLAPQPWLTPAALEVWLKRPDLQAEFDLLSPEALENYFRWTVLSGRFEKGADFRYSDRQVAFAQASRKDGGLPRLQEWIWESRPDVQQVFPEPAGKNRAGFANWFANHAPAEHSLGPSGTLPVSGKADGDVSLRLLEALVMARPRAMMNGDGIRAHEDWLREGEAIDVLVVGSDHPSNVQSIRWFVEQVVPELPRTAKICIAGRVGQALDAATPANVALLGEVFSLDPLYAVTRVVAAPVIYGTGVPIKVLDAIMQDLPLSTTELVDRGTRLASAGFPLAVTAQDMVADITALLGSEKAWAARRDLGRRYKRKFLTRDVYFAAWTGMLDGKGVRNGRSTGWNWLRGRGSRAAQ